MLLEASLIVAPYEVKSSSQQLKITVKILPNQVGRTFKVKVKIVCLPNGESSAKSSDSRPLNTAQTFNSYR